MVTVKCDVFVRFWKILRIDTYSLIRRDVKAKCVSIRSFKIGLPDV